MDKKPNIIVFMTDHQRYDTVFPYNRAITPNFSALAERATVFTHAYCPSPHCCPSRASFFSGLYPSEHGVWNNVDVGNTLSRRLNDHVRLFPQMLQKAGYRCCFSGKWHVSSEQAPSSFGFEEVFNFNGSYVKKGRRPDDYEWDLYYKSVRGGKICDADTERGEGQIVREGYPLYTQYGNSENPYADGTTVEEALKMLQKKDERPLFMYVGVTGPHDPYIPPKEFEDLYSLQEIQLPPSFHDDMENRPNLYKRTKSMYDRLTENEHRKSILKYLAFCSYEDHLFGKIVAEAKKLAGDTVILYLSDHGDYCGDHGLWAKGLPCFEGAYRIPLLIYDSRVQVGQVREEAVNLCDLAPTVLEAAGIKSKRKFSGSSVYKLVKQEPCEWTREEICTQSNGNELYGIQRSIRTKQYKLVYNGFDFDEFYDLELDPHETVNRIGEDKYKDVIRDLYKRLWQFAYEHKDTCINPYIMVGLAQYGPGIIFGK